MNLIKATIDYLNQNKAYLASISQADYIEPIPQMSHSTIGKHTRHFVECYQCLINQQSEGKICYDSRFRNLEMEEDPKAALKVLEAIIEKLPSLDPSKQLLLHTNLLKEAPILTNLNRELLHNYEHTTHHLALIRIGLTLLAVDVSLPVNFGVASSTLLHQLKN